jgi:hypothetical protein
MGIKNQSTRIVALKGLYIPARSNAPGIKIRPISCPERALQLLSPFRAAIKSYLVPPGAARSCFVYAFQAIFKKLGSMLRLTLNLSFIRIYLHFRISTRIAT